MNEEMEGSVTGALDYDCNPPLGERVIKDTGIREIGNRGHVPKILNAHGLDRVPGAVLNCHLSVEHRHDVIGANGTIGVRRECGPVVRERLEIGGRQG